MTPPVAPLTIAPLTTTVCHHPCLSSPSPSQFAVRIRESELETLPEVLSSFSPREIKAMQHNLAQVWTRFVYTGTRATQQAAGAVLRDNAARATAKEWERGAARRAAIAERVESSVPGERARGRVSLLVRGWPTMRT